MLDFLVWSYLVKFIRVSRRLNSSAYSLLLVFFPFVFNRKGDLLHQSDNSDSQTGFKTQGVPFLIGFCILLKLYYHAVHISIK